MINKLVDSTSNHFYNIFKSYLPIMNIGKKTIEYIKNKN